MQALRYLLVCSKEHADDFDIANGGVSKDIKPKCKRYDFNEYESICTIVYSLSFDKFFFAWAIKGVLVFPLVAYI